MIIFTATFCYKYNQLYHLTIDDCLRLAPFLTRLRVPSLPLCRMTKEKSLVTKLFWTELTSSEPNIDPHLQHFVFYSVIICVLSVATKRV
jgi:hypothetical protein